MMQNLIENCYLPECWSIPICFLGDQSAIMGTWGFLGLRDFSAKMGSISSKLLIYILRKILALQPSGQKTNHFLSCPERRSLCLDTELVSWLINFSLLVFIQVYSKQGFFHSKASMTNPMTIDVQRKQPGEYCAPIIFFIPPVFIAQSLYNKLGQVMLQMRADPTHLGLVSDKANK